MAMTWTQLTASKSTAGSVANWLNNSQVTSGTGGVADTLLQEAMNWITGSGLKHWRAFTSATGTLTIGNDYIAQPSDFYEADIFYLTGLYFQRLDMKTAQQVIASWSYDGSGARIQAQPMFYYVGQGTLQFETCADQAYAYQLWYYQNVADLSDSNQTNFLTKYYARLVRCAVMAHAAEWAKDSGMGNYDRGYWLQQALMEQEAAQADSDRSRRATEFAAQIVGGGGGGFPMYNGMN